MKTKPITKEQNALEQLSKEALEILEILNEIENHTASLRKKLMSELQSKTKDVKLKLDEV